MNTFGLVLIMGGALLVWAGLTDNSIIELLKSITGRSTTVKPSKPTNQNPGRPLPRPVQQK